MGYGLIALITLAIILFWMWQGSSAIITHKVAGLTPPSFWKWITRKAKPLF